MNDHRNLTDTDSRPALPLADSEMTVAFVTLVATIAAAQERDANGA